MRVMMGGQNKKIRGEQLQSGKTALERRAKKEERMKESDGLNGATAGKNARWCDMMRR